MAFDNETRGKLQKFVTDIRALLTEDFTRQLQQTYGMDPASGDVAPLDSLKHLAAIIHEAPVLARGAMFEGPLLLDAHR